MNLDSPLPTTGVPVLYGLLLYVNRWSILGYGPETRMKSATVFLWEDLKPVFFWWEPFEQFRKLTLTGFILMVPTQSEQGRVLIAISVSLFFLTLQLICRPFRSSADNWLMTFVHLALLLLYLSILVIKTCDISVASCKSYGLGETSEGVYLFFFVFAIALLMVLVILGLANLW